MKKKIYDIIINKLGLDELNDSDRLEEDLGADSLDIIEIVMELEKELSISITDDEVDENFKRGKTVGDIVAYCEQRTQQ